MDEGMDVELAAAGPSHSRHHSVWFYLISFN